MQMRGTARPGFALALTLLVVVGVTTLAAGAILIGTNGSLIRQYWVREEEMTRAAEAGIEQARARINGDRSLYPAANYNALESNAQVLARDGSPIPGMTRSTYVGPVGITTGQYGVHGAIVSVINSGNSTLIRRGQVVQESFSKFAYFTDVEGAIVFGGGDQIFGPAHSNDEIEIASTRATFHGLLTTAQRITGKSYGTYRAGYDEGVARIPLPQVADLNALQVQASQGGTAFAGTTRAEDGRATTRIEFIAIDLNGDGDNRDDDEGFFRIYQTNNAAAAADYVVGANTNDDLRTSLTCGHMHGTAPNDTFVAAFSHSASASGAESRINILQSATRRCVLGGDPALTGGVFTPTTPNQRLPSGVNQARWLQWGGAVSGLLAGRADRQYLFPITRPLNPSFKGVIYINGDVAISGVLRGRVTIAATGDIVIADDITYATDPAVGGCVDILGLFAGGNIVLSNTPLNAPWKPQNTASYFTYDADSKDEFIHGFLLTLNEFHVEDHDTGSNSAEDCQTTNWGRGCLYLTGGIIQRTRGPVGTTGGTGYVKRYSYDPCGQSQPPPYFPTTGIFSRNAFYEVDPAGFSVASYFNMLAAGN